jgi:hypothetical protein
MYLAMEELPYPPAFWHIIDNGSSITVFVGFSAIKEAAHCFYVNLSRLRMHIFSVVTEHIFAAAVPPLQHISEGFVIFAIDNVQLVVFDNILPDPVFSSVDLLKVNNYALEVCWKAVMNAGLQIITIIMASHGSARSLSACFEEL